MRSYLFLATANQAQMEAALGAAGIAIPEGGLVADEQLSVVANGVVTNVDVIGQDPRELDEQLGCYDAVTKEPIWKQYTGYFVNVVTTDPDLPAALASVNIPPPLTPMRVFAGYSV